MDSDHESTDGENEENLNREQIYYCVEKSLARCHHDKGTLVEGRFIATYGGWS